MGGNAAEGMARGMDGWSGAGSAVAGSVRPTGGVEPASSGAKADAAGMSLLAYAPAAGTQGWGGQCNEWQAAKYVPVRVTSKQSS